MPSAIEEAGGSRTPSRPSSPDFKARSPAGCPPLTWPPGRGGFTARATPAVSPPPPTTTSPTRGLVRVELEQEVGGSALLERAGHLEVLEFDEAARAGELRERLRVGEG